MTDPTPAAADPDDAPITEAADGGADDAPASTPAEVTLCPYCGFANTNSKRCTACAGLFETFSLRATQIAMGPWFMRDKAQPFRPGCSFETLTKMVDAGKLKPTTVLRGPTTKQFWSVARNVPGIAHRLGYCHNCNAHVQPTASACPSCQAHFPVPNERNELGLQYPTAAVARAAQKKLDADIARSLGTAGTADAAPVVPAAPVPAPASTQAFEAPAVEAAPVGQVAAGVPETSATGDLLSDVFGGASPGVGPVGQLAVAPPASAAVPVVAAVGSTATPIAVAQPVHQPAVVEAQGEAVPGGGLSTTAIIMITLNAVLLIVAAFVVWLLMKGG